MQRALGVHPATLGSASLAAFLQRLAEAPGLAQALSGCLTPPMSVAELRALCQEHANVPLTTFEDGDMSHPASPCYDAWLIYQFLSHTPWLSLLILSTTIIDVCGEDVPQRAAGLQSLARTLHMWEDAPETLKEAERLVKNAPAHLECNMIIPLGVETEALRPMVELLKLMPQDLETLRRSFVSSTERQLYLVAVVLTKFGVVDQSLFQLKALIDSPMSSAHTLMSLMSSNAPAVAAVPETALALTVPVDSPKLQLKLLKQCDDKTVYHKILKPYPTLELIGGDNVHELKVQAELYKHTEHPSDADEQLPYLEGERVVGFESGRQCYAYFKKLKFSGTSTQIGGAPFMLKFQVVRDVVVGELHRVVAVPGLAVYSKPIFVYSHTTYLKGGGPKPAGGGAKKKSGGGSVRKRERGWSDDEDDEDGGNEWNQDVE